MKIPPFHVLLLTMSVLASVPACSPDEPTVAGRRLPIEPAAAEATAITNAKTMARELWAAEKWLEESDPVDRAVDVLFPTEEEVEDVQPTLPAGLFLPSEAEEFEAFLADLVEVLADKLFVDANIESRRDDEIVYRVVLDAFCQFGDDDEGEPSSPPDCASAVDDVPVRARVTRLAQDDIDVTILIGASRHEAAVLELHHDVVALSVNLTAAREIAEALAENIVEEVTGDAEIALDGTFKLSVRRLTENQIRLAADVTDPIVIEVKSDDDEGRGALSLERGSVALNVEAGQGTATLDVDLGRLAFETSKQVWADSNVECWESESSGPDGDVVYTEECEEALDVEGSVAIALDRCAFLVNLSDVVGSVAFRGLLIGPLSLTSDEATAFELTLDDSKSPVDVDVATTPDSLTMTLSRAAGLGALMRMNLLEDVIEDMADWMADEQLGVAMDGTAPSILIDKEQVHVLAGTLTLTSRYGPETEVVVEAGQCLWSPEPEDVVVEPGDEEPEKAHIFDMESGACQQPDPTEEM